MAAGDVKVVLTKNRAFNCNVFDGADDYVEVPHHWRQLGANLTAGFTLSAWINPRSIGETGGRIFDKTTASSGAGGFNLYLGANFVGSIINAGAGRVSAAGSIILGSANWYHVAVTVSPTVNETRLYVNGVQSGITQVVTDISGITTTNAIRIGNRATATDRSFDGSIKSVKMWDRVLTTAEIAQDYAGYTPPTPIHNFKLGGDYADYGTCGVTATNSGSIVQTVSDSIAVATKAQRVAATDKWMCYRGLEGQVGIVNIE